MSTAVLISGQMRTAEHCADSILDAFPGADFYIHCVADEDCGKAQLFRAVANDSYVQQRLVERDFHHRNKGRGVHGVQQVLQQLYGLAKVWETYVAAGGDHDWIVRCRPDIQFIVPPEPESARGGKIMIPRFCNYWGYNDRFAMVRRDVAMRYFTRWDMLDYYLHNGGIFHPETFLKWSVEDCAMVRTDAVFHTVRKDGSRDEPLYFTESGDEQPAHPEGTAVL
jgi:hypothetical protein